MNPTENTQPIPENAGAEAAQGEQALKPPVIGFCRATGKALSAEEATYVNGVLYSKDYAATMKPGPATEAPYSGAAATVQKPSDVSPGWAFVLGLIPGVGAIYNQQYAKGMLHIIIFATLISLVDRGSTAGPFLVVLLTGWYFYMPFEAFHTAQKRQRGESVDELSGLVTLPEGMKRLPVGPVLLIGLGVIFLLDNLGLLRVEEVLRFWPVLMIAAGVLMLVQRLQGATATREGNSHVE